jgi:thiol-disulfide isomerase/thioredoxin
VITTKLARQFRISACTLLLLLAAGAAAAPDVGDTPPDYIGKTVDGVPVQLSQHPGKVLVVSFWATWCPYCLKELPILNGNPEAGRQGANARGRGEYRRARRFPQGCQGLEQAGKIQSLYRGYSESSLEQIADDINRALAAPKPVAKGAT